MSTVVFMDWLESKGAKDAYLGALKGSSVFTHPANKSCWVTEAFSWKSTAPGHAFWYHLNNEWLAIISNNNSEIIFERKVRLLNPKDFK